MAADASLSCRALRPDTSLLFCIHPVGNSCTTGKRLITEGRLPVSSHDELRTIQKLSTIQISPGKIGTVQ